MAKIISMVDGAVKTVLKDEYFSLSVDAQMPVMAKVMQTLGIELSEESIREDLTELFKQAKEAGITNGRLTARLPKGYSMKRAISALDAEGIRPNGVAATYIDDGMTGKTVGELIRSGKLNGAGMPGEVEFRILPCAEGYKERMHGSRRLEPVGLFYDQSQKQQKSLFEDYQVNHSGLDVQYATPLEILVSALYDRLAGVDPRSDNITFNHGWYRTTIPVPGPVRRCLCVYSDSGRLWLLWYEYLGAESHCAVVTSVGVKK